MAKKEEGDYVKHGLYPAYQREFKEVEITTQNWEAWKKAIKKTTFTGDDEFRP